LIAWDRSTTKKDPEVESRWTHDISYLRTLGQNRAPAFPAQMKKKYERIEKQVDEARIHSISPSA
jgi:hypothetical protein